MLKIVAFYLCCTILLVSGNGSGSVQLVPNSSSVHTQVKAKDSSVNIPPEPPAAPTSDQPPVTSTKKPTTTTTSKPDNVTTTAKPDTTTTVAPSPSPPPPNTTTVAPTTTTTAPITTPPPPPTPLPAPKAGQWIVNATNQTCIVVRMAVQFNITYLTKDNKTEYKMLTLPTEENSTVATGDCGTKEQTLNITWHGGNDSLALHFVKNETTKNYYMHHVQVFLSLGEFPDIKSNATLELVHEPNQFTTGLTNSYRCMRLQNMNLTTGAKNGTVSWLKVSDLQFQAFKTDKATTFGLAQDCSSDVPDVVPIAVGCVLTALVVFVLVAYLVGRRRSQARGYLSM